MRCNMKDDKIEIISRDECFNSDYRVMTIDEVVNTFFKDIFNTGVNNEEEDFWKKLEKTTSK